MLVHLHNADGFSSTYHGQLNYEIVYEATIAEGEHRPYFELTNDKPYLVLTGQLWVIIGGNSVCLDFDPDVHVLFGICRDQWMQKYMLNFLI